MKSLSFSLFYPFLSLLPFPLLFISSIPPSSAIALTNSEIFNPLLIRSAFKNVRFFSIQVPSLLSFLFSLSPPPPADSSSQALEEDEIREARGGGSVRR